MKKLERKHARMVLGFLGAAVVAAFAAMFLMETDEMMGSAAFLAFLGFAALALYTRFHFLKCPYCRRGVAVARWNPSGRKDKCPVCKSLFVFDDEIKVRR